MSVSRYKKWMTEAFINEADDDDNYVHVGGGRYKEVNKRTGEALPNSPSYIKKDSGGYEMVDDDDPRLSKDDDKEKKTPVSIDIDASGGLGGDDEEKPSGEEPEDDGPPFDDPGSDDNWWKEGGSDPIDDEKLKDWIKKSDDYIEDFKSKGDDEAAAEHEESKAQYQRELDRRKEKGGKEESIKVINGKKYRAIKESVDKRISVKEVKSWLKGLEEYRYRKIPGVDARRIASFINNGLSEMDLPKSLQKKWEHAKYSKEKGLADRFIKQRISQKLTQTESKHPIKENYDRLFTNRVVL